MNADETEAAVFERLLESSEVSSRQNAISNGVEKLLSSLRSDLSVVACGDHVVQKVDQVHSDFVATCSVLLRQIPVDGHKRRGGH